MSVSHIRLWWRGWRRAGMVPAIFLLMLAGTPATRVDSAPGHHSTGSPFLPAVHQRIEASLPVAREEVASAAADSHLYVIGGFDVAGHDTRTVFVLDRGRWRQGPGLPLSVDHAAATTLDGTVYVVGGFHSGTASAQTLALPPGGRSWLRQGPLRHPRGALALVAIHHALFAIGGKDGAGIEIPTVEKYDPRTRAWHDESAVPAPRDHLSGFALGGAACAAGGRSPTTSRVDCYDPVRHAWSRLPDLPDPTSGAGAAGMGGSVMVGGGEDAAEGRIITQLFRLRFGRWTRSTMLLPRHGLQFVPFRGRIWACGGGLQPGLHPSTACTSLR